MAIEDFWGNLTVVDPENSPNRILQEQSNLLTEKTNRQLIGTVLSQVLNNRIRTTLAISAPALDHYQFDVVSILHTIKYSEDPQAEDSYPVIVIDEIEGDRKKCNSEEEFKEKLKTILSSPKTKNAIGKVMHLLESQNSNIS